MEEIGFQLKMITPEELKCRLWGMGFANPRTRYKEKMIEDIPIMITDSGKLLCVPNTEEIKHVGIVGMTGCQPAGSKVLMADGSWKNIEKIKKGDLVISPQKEGGNIFAKVKSTTKWFSNENYEIKEQNRNKRSLYRCSHNHIIPFYFRSKKSSKDASWKIRQETASHFNKYDELANSRIGFSSFLIEKFKGRKNCEIEAYTLGVFLGDGCSIYKEYKRQKYKALSITSMNEEIIDEVSKFYPIMSIRNKEKSKAKQYNFSVKGELQKQIEKYGLKGKKSGDKFIPKEALLSDSEYRKKLLAGLIDTDGTIKDGTSYNLVTISKSLAEDIKFLIYSLGGRCSIKKYKSSIKSSNFIGERYIISFYLHKLELPLKLKYKIRNKKFSYLSSNRLAISVKKSEPGMVYGFQINSPSKWYVTDNWMATHNSCKSIFLNAFLSWDYWLAKRKCLVLNDFQKETFEWSLPTDTPSFFYSLKKINAKPCPTPLVYIFPTTKSLQIEPSDKRFPLIKMTLPLEEVIKNVENYHKLDKSKVYLANIKEKLEDCNSIQEIREVLEEEFPEREQKLMRFKLMNIFEDLFENHILNVAVPNAPSYLEYKKKEVRYYNKVVQTILRANLIPSIQTSDLSNYEFFSAYMSYIVSSLYENQYHDSYFKTQTISLFVDEIDKLWLGFNGNLIKRALSLIGTNGRMARIGLRWATQHYKVVPVGIRSNTKFLVVSRQKDSKEVSEIRKDFDIPKWMEKDILNLKSEPEKGIFEVIAVTTERFILYDLTTGEKKLSSEAQKGELVCPIARHHRPNTKL